MADTENGSEEYKNKGNEAFKQQKWDEAIKNYNKAIQVNPNQASYYSNRAACWSSKGNHESALNDAKQCVKADPAFVKGHSRMGKAYFDLGRFDEAEEAYKKGLEVDPNNAGCQTGLTDVQRSKRLKPASSGSSMFGSGGFAGKGQKLVDTMKKGFGGKMQMYGVFMVGYFIYNNFANNRGKSTTVSDASDADGSFDDVGGETTGGDSGHAAAGKGWRTKRNFVSVGGSWVSYLETGSVSDNTVLMLHDTSSSAETEFGASLARFAEKSVDTSSKFRVLIPDRPCHGYSPCLGRTMVPGAWMQNFITSRTKLGRLLIVASGKAAAAQALSLGRWHQQPCQFLLVSPTAEGPAALGADDVQNRGKVLEWLENHNSIRSAASIADAARWVSNAEDAKSDANDSEVERRLSGNGLPEGTRVTLLYADGEKEDADLKEELETTGFFFKLRRVSEDGPLAMSPALAEAVAEETFHLLSSVGEDTNL